MSGKMRMYLSAAAAVLALIVSSFAAFSPAGQAVQKAEEGYMLGAWCGKVAIYAPNGTEPMETTEIELKNLPSMDRKCLEEGIYLENKEELAQLLEDLGS